MTYTYQSAYTSPAQTPGRPRGVQGIVIHWWGYPSQSGTHAGTVGYLTRAGAATSAHYVVSPGLVSCIVDPDAIAWHAGNWSRNEETVGIECNPHDVAGTLPTVIELVAELMRTYGRDLYVVGHRDCTSTTCPGDYYPLIERIRSGALALLDGPTRASAAAEPEPEPESTPEPDPNPTESEEDTMKPIAIVDSNGGCWLALPTSVAKVTEAEFWAQVETFDLKRIDLPIEKVQALETAAGRLAGKVLS